MPLPKTPKIKNAFEWTKSYDIDIDTAKHYRLIKGVAMSEGFMKRGEPFDENLLRYATGALAASAALGFAIIDVDHWADKIPSQKELTEMGEKDYNYEKYDVEKLNADYPIGMIIDAELVRNNAGVDGAPKWQVEYLAACTNEYAYSLIKAKMFVGNSVMDFPRTYTCDSCDADTGECTCESTASKFLYNTLILEAVPNSNSTWVSVVDENDIGGILKPNATKHHNKHELLDYKLSMFRMNQQQKKLEIQVIKNKLVTADLKPYQTNGAWNDVDAAIEFLVNEKQIPADQAAEIGAYIFANPGLLNKYQLETLSGDDLIAWFYNSNKIDRHKFKNFIKNMMPKSKTVKTAKNVKNTTTRNIKKPNPNYAKLKVFNFVGLTPEEVNYRDTQEETACSLCRWSSFADDPIEIESEGTCQIVAINIKGGAVCDRFEAIPGEEPAEGDDEEPAEGGDEEPAEEEQNKNDDAADTETPENTDEPIAEDTEDATETTDAEDATETTDAEDATDADEQTETQETETEEDTEEEEDDDDDEEADDKDEEERKEKQASTPPTKKHKAKPTAKINPEKQTKANITKLDDEILKLENKKKNLGLILGTSTAAMKLQAEHDHITKEIARYHALKKNKKSNSKTSST